jgi:hypothetical protein
MENQSSSLWAYFIAFVISVVANALTAIVSWYVKKRPKRFDRLIIALVVIIVGGATAFLILRLSSAPKKAEEVFSDFDDGVPRNKYKVRWGVFNDNEYKGNSNITIETQSSEAGQNPYAELSYFMGKNSSTPFCGIFSWFAHQPIDIRNISVYDGIQLEAWHEHEKDFPDGVHVYLQISPYELIDNKNGFFECEFTIGLKQNTVRGNPIQLPFSSFRISRKFERTDSAQFETVQKGLSKEFQGKIYQISITIEGKSGTEGKIDFDNLKFYYDEGS